MVRDSTKRLFNVIIVWKLDRFARNCYDSAHNKVILRKNGVKVISATEKIAEDSTGILLESLLEGHAGFYSALVGDSPPHCVKSEYIYHIGDVFGFVV